MIRIALLGTLLAAAGMPQQTPQTTPAAPPAAPATPQAAPAARPPAGPRPVEDFASLPMIEDPAISPDGKLLAAKIAVNGKLYFGIVPLDGVSSPKLLPVEYDLNWWRWVNNGWLAVGIGDSVPGYGGEEWYVQRVLGVSADATKINQLAPREAAQSVRMIWSAHDGSPRALITAQTSIFSNDLDFWPTIYEVDVSTGKRRIAVGSREGVMHWVADGNGAVRMGIRRSIDGRELRVLYRPGATGSFREIVRNYKVGSDDDLVLPSLFLAEPGKALAYARDSNGFGAIYAYDLNALKLGERLYASAGYDVDGLIPTRGGDALAGVAYDEAGPRIQWVDADLAAMQVEVSKMIQGGRAVIESWSDDRQRAVVLVSGPDSPGAYFLYERASGAMVRLATRNEAIGMSRLHPVKTIRYKARDGLEIAAVLTLPRGKTANLPLIVMPHGGPSARDNETWDWWAQFLADRGYAVIQPNYRGSTGYGEAFEARGEGQWGLAMQDDLNDAIAHLAKGGTADPKRVCIVGASYGGYAALRAAQRDSALYRCAVSFAGVSDLGAMKRYDSQFLGSGASADWLKEQAPDFRAVSPVFGAQSFGIPVLIVHGREDRTVPFSQSREMAEKLRAAGKPFTFVEQKEGDHHFSRAEDRLEFLKALEAFLKQHNPA